LWEDLKNIVLVQRREVSLEMLMPNPCANTSSVGRQTFFFPLSISEM